MAGSLSSGLRLILLTAGRIGFSWLLLYASTIDCGLVYRRWVSFFIMRLSAYFVWVVTEFSVFLSPYYWPARWFVSVFTQFWKFVGYSIPTGATE
jgi:hypothetical protein